VEQSGRFDELRSFARERGEAWARYTFHECPADRDRAWPVRGAEIHRIARSWCAELTDDESLLLILAVDAVSAAAACWGATARRNHRPA